MLNVLNFGQWMLYITGLVILVVAAWLFNESWEDYRRYLFEQLGYISNQAKKMMLTSLLLMALGLSMTVPYSLKLLNYFNFGKNSVKHSQGEIVSCKGSKICEKLKDLKELQKKIYSKRDELINLRNEYQNSIQQLEAEIRAEKKEKGINSYRQALSNSKISFNLNLIQRKEAYIAKLDEVIPKLDKGANELEFLRRQAEDDLKMEIALGSKDAEKLAEDIDKVIRKYPPESDQFVIKIDKDSIPSAESIWNRINSR